MISKKSNGCNSVGNALKKKPHTQVEEKKPVILSANILYPLS